jgi:hypothetical protein
VVVQSDEEKGGVSACDQEVDADMVQYLQDAGRWMGEEDKEVKEEEGDGRGGEGRCGGRGVCCREEDDNVGGGELMDPNQHHIMLE